VDINGHRSTWNDPVFFSKIRNVMTGAGYTVGADVDAVAANLAGYDSFVIGGAGRAATATEISNLSVWVAAGGSLLVFNDRDLDAAPLNALLAGIGSSIAYGGATMDQNFYLNGGVFATTTPNSVAGQFLSGTPGRVVTGGTTLTAGGAAWTASQKSAAEAYIHYQQLGLGYIFVFGDRLDHDYFTFGAGLPRTNFFLNLGSYTMPSGGDPPGGPVTNETPEPAGALLVGGGVAVLLRTWRKRAA
jgi:hypothetical protein